MIGQHKGFYFADEANIWLKILFSFQLKKYIRMGITILKPSFGEVYHWIYGQKSCFTAPLMRHGKT